MNTSPLGTWLNSACGWFDTPILTAFHRFAEDTGGFFTPGARFHGLVTDNGIAFPVAGVVLFVLGSRRKAVTLLGAVSLAGALVLFLSFDKRWSWVTLVLAASVGLSRCYLLVHYPSDVVAAALLGGAATALWVTVCRRAFSRVPLLGGLR